MKFCFDQRRLFDIIEGGNTIIWFDQKKPWSLLDKKLPFRQINVLILCLQLMPITMSIIGLHNEKYKKFLFFLFPCCGLLLYFFASLFVSVIIYLSGFYHVTIFRKWNSDHLPVFRFLHIFAIWILSHFRVFFVLICFVCRANYAEAHNVLK